MKYYQKKVKQEAASNELDLALDTIEAENKVTLGKVRDQTASQVSDTDGAAHHAHRCQTPAKPSLFSASTLGKLATKKKQKSTKSTKRRLF